MLGAALLLALLSASQGPTVSAPDLTVPAERLPPGCVLLPNSLLAGVPTNPWSGADDAPLLAKLRAMVEGAPPLPEGPPPSRVDMTQLMLQRADGVEEGYAAFYSTRENMVISVFAVRLTVPPERQRTSDAYRSRRVGPWLVMHSAIREGRCEQAIRAHLADVGK